MKKEIKKEKTDDDTSNNKKKRSDDDDKNFTKQKTKKPKKDKPADSEGNIKKLVKGLCDYLE